MPDDTPLRGPDVSEAPSNGVEMDAGTAGEQQALVDSEEELIQALVRRGRKSQDIVKLTRDEEDRLVERIIRDFEDAEGQMTVFKQDNADAVAEWRGEVTPKSFPFEGANNIRTPLTQDIIEQTKARLHKAMLGGEKVVEFTALDNYIEQDTLDELNDWFKWELEEIVEFDTLIDDILHDVCVSGIGLAVPQYVHEERVLVSLREFEIADGQPLTEQVEAALMQLFQNETAQIEKQTAPGEFEMVFQARGEDVKSARVSFAIVNDRLVATIEKPETIFDGVRVHRINLEDLVVVNSDVSIEKIPFFGCRVWLLLTDFLAGVGGRFRSFNATEISEFKAKAKDKSSTEAVDNESTRDTDADEGTLSTDPSATDLTRKWLEIYRWEGRYSPYQTEHIGDASVRDDTEEAIGVVAWVDLGTRRIIKIARLEEMNKDGKRSATKFDFLVQPDRFFSLSLRRWLRHIQDEMDAIHNQRLDAGLLSNVPFGFYEPTAGLQKAIFQLEPGKMYPVKNAAAVNFPKINWTPFWSFQEEANVRKYGMEHAGLSESAAGSFISKRASASEFMATAAAGDLRTERLLRRMLRALRHLLTRIFGQYQQFSQEGRVYQVTGEKGETLVKYLSKDRMNGKLALRLTGNLQQLSAQLERDVAVNMLSLLLNELLIQLGIVKPDTIFAAMQKVFRASDYRGVVLHRPDVPPESPPPNVEHKRMMLGQPVAPSPSENFNEHLAAHMQLASSPNIDQYLPDQRAVVALGEHIKQTMILQKQVEIMRAVQAAQAANMKGTMDAMGVRPGMAGGSQPGDQAQPGTQEEGVPTGPNEGEA